MVLGFSVPNKKSFEKVSKKTKEHKQNGQHCPWLHMSEEMDLGLINYYII